MDIKFYRTLSNIMIVNRGVDGMIDKLYREWNKLNHDYRWKRKFDARTEYFKAKLKLLNKKVNKVVEKYPRDEITMMNNKDVEKKSTWLDQGQGRDIAVTGASSLDDIAVYRFNRGILLSHPDLEDLTKLIHSLPQIEFEYLKFNKNICGYMCSQANGYELYKLGICALDFSDRGLGIKNSFPDASVIKPITKQLKNISMSKERFAVDFIPETEECEHQKNLYVEDGKYELVHDLDFDRVKQDLKRKLSGKLHYHTDSKLVCTTWEADKLDKNSSFFELGKKGAMSTCLFKKHKDVEFTLIEMVLAFDEGDETHINTLIVDHDRKKIFRFEPHGSYTDSYSMTICDTRLVFFLDRYVKVNAGVDDLGFEYVPPSLSFPREGPQLKSDMCDLDLKIYVDEDGNSKVENDGYCLIWNLLLIDLNRIHNYHPLNIFKILDEEQLEKCAYKVREYASGLVENYKIK